MLKILKWVYQLGYDKGYGDAINQNKIRFVNPKPAQSDDEFIQEVDEIMQKETIDKV